MTPQALVSLGRPAKRNEMAVFVGVTGKASRLAPPYTFATGRDPYNIKGLAVDLNVLRVALLNWNRSHAPRSAHVSCDYACFVAPWSECVTRSGVHPKI